jgi:hypothetical protein
MKDLRMGQVYRMAASAGFMKPKRGDGRAVRSAPARSPRRADDQSHGAVTREELDAARYIADMTAKLEAVAIAARLDPLVYFLAMAKAESETFVRTCGVPEAKRAEEESDEPAVGLHQENTSFD